MKNSKLRRVLLLASCAVMLVCLSVGATLAYLTATTGTVTNTFSVGKVSFMTKGLDEADVDDHGNLLYKTDKDNELTPDENNAKKEDGQAVLADRVQANSYKLLPAHDYVKDPTIHVAANSDEFYLFIYINKTGLKDKNGDSIEAGKDENGKLVGEYDTIANQLATNNWVQLTTDATDPETSTEVTNIYVYKGENKFTRNTLDGQAEDIKIFEGFSLKNLNNFDNVNASELEIKIQAYAIQADGFDTPYQAWTALAIQNPPVTDNNQVAGNND